MWECLLEKSQKTNINKRNDTVLQSTSTLRCFCCCFNRFSFFFFRPPLLVSFAYSLQYAASILSPVGVCVYILFLPGMCNENFPFHFCFALQLQRTFLTLHTIFSLGSFLFTYILCKIYAHLLLCSVLIIVPTSIPRASWSRLKANLTVAARIVHPQCVAGPYVSYLYYCHIILFVSLLFIVSIAFSCSS